MDESGDQNTKIDGDNNSVTNVKQSASENQVILPKEIYRENLENAVRVKELEMQATHGKEREIFQAQIDKLNNDLANLPQAFEKAQTQIADLKAKLEREGNEIGAEKLAVAITALEQGDFSKADELFAEIEAREELAVERSARSAFARGEIAEQEVRWQDAAEHYARAAQLAPYFETLIKAQNFALDTGNYNSALSFGLDAEKAAIAEYKENSEQHANSLNNLAGVYTAQGHYEQAEPLYEKALKICYEKLGKKNLLTAISISSLASNYHMQKKYDEAELLYKKALKIRQETPEKDDVAIATSFHNLASLYHEQDKHTEAEDLYKKALNICLETLGENHPYTATSMSNLAGIYQRQKRYTESEPLYKKAIKISQEKLGANHPKTANCLNNLAMLYCAEKKYDEAEPLCRESVKIFEAALGPDHPNIKRVKINYAKLKKAQADLANAKKTKSQ